MTKRPFDAARALRVLADIRAHMPRAARPSRRPPAHDGRMAAPATEEEFEMAALEEALGSLLTELSDGLHEMQRGLFQQALDVYYTAEEMSRDGQHPELIPHVEAMRAAYEKEVGTPIPPKKKE